MRLGVALEPEPHLRLFVALAVAEPVRLEIKAAQAQLKRMVPSKGARWTRTEQLHLTVRFLGNVQASRVPELTRALREACGTFAPLRLRAAGLGFFPGARRPRVLWVGVQDDTGELARLWKAVQTGTENFTAEEAEKHFSGHITLARLSQMNSRETDTLAAAVSGSGKKVFGEWTARELELVQSQLSPQGARHSLVAGIGLVAS